MVVSCFRYWSMNPCARGNRKQFFAVCVYAVNMFVVSIYYCVHLLQMCDWTVTNTMATPSAVPMMLSVHMQGELDQGDTLGQ